MSSDTYTETYAKPRSGWWLCSIPWDGHPDLPHKREARNMNTWDCDGECVGFTYSADVAFAYVHDGTMPAAFAYVQTGKPLAVSHV